MKEFDLDGVDLTSETAAAEIMSRVDAHIAGLKSKNAELIGRESDIKKSFEDFKIEAEKEKHEIAKALAEKNNSVEDFKIALQNEKDAMTNLESTFKQERESRILGDGINEFLSGIADKPSSKLWMETQFKDGVHVVDGLLKPKNEALTIEDLKHSLVTDKANAEHIKTNVGSGGGSQGQGVNNTVVDTKNEDAESAKAKGDGIGHLNAHFKQAFKQGT